MFITVKLYMYVERLKELILNKINTLEMKINKKIYKLMHKLKFADVAGVFLLLLLTIDF